MLYSVKEIARQTWSPLITGDPNIVEEPEGGVLKAPWRADDCSDEVSSIPSVEMGEGVESVEEVVSTESFRIVVSTPMVRLNSGRQTCHFIFQGPPRIRNFDDSQKDYNQKKNGSSITR